MCPGTFYNTQDRDFFTSMHFFYVHPKRAYTLARADVNTLNPISCGRKGILRATNSIVLSHFSEPARSTRNSFALCTTVFFCEHMVRVEGI